MYWDAGRELYILLPFRAGIWPSFHTWSRYFKPKPDPQFSFVHNDRFFTLALNVRPDLSPNILTASCPSPITTVVSDLRKLRSTNCRDTDPYPSMPNGSGYYLSLESGFESVDQAHSLKKDNFAEFSEFRRLRCYLTEMIQRLIKGYKGKYSYPSRPTSSGKLSQQRKYVRLTHHQTLSPDQY